MERLKKILHVGILVGAMAMMVAAFSLQVNAAKMVYALSDITSSNATLTVTDGVTYTTILTPSSEYKLPAKIDVAVRIGEESQILNAADGDYKYDPQTGKLEIRGDKIKGEVAIVGVAVKLKSLEVPTVKGSFVVYETLNAVVFPADATVTYQWYRGERAINGATASSYVLTKTDIGQEINVQITGIGDFGGQKISTSNVLISKKTQTAPSKSDVAVTNVTKNGGIDGTILSNSARALEYYDTVSTTWKDLPARNRAAGEYQVRFKETDDSLPSASIMVRIFEPCTSPVATDVTITHLTVAGASTGKMVANTTKVLEFYNGTAWVTFPVQGLRAGKYQVRFAETTDYLASAPVNFFVKEPTTLLIAPQDVKVTNVTEKGTATGAMRHGATNTAVMEAQVEGIWKALPLTGLKAGTYRVRYAATDTTFESAACDVIIKEPGDVPVGIKVTDVTVHGGNTGAITGLKPSWQVSYDGKTWSDCTQTSLTGLSAGVFHFRTKETETHLASAAVKYTVKQPEATPAATIDYINGRLRNLVAKAQYAIDGTLYTADETGTISVLENNLAGRSIALAKKGNGETTNDSAKQTVNIPARPAIPAAPQVTQKTDTAVTIASIMGLEYSIDGKTWVTATENSYTFTGLRVNTAYTVLARVKAIEGRAFCSANAGTNVTTKKSASSAKPATKIETVEITDTAITVKAVSGQEYRLNEGEWVLPSGAQYTWTKLTSNTRYTIQTRTAETVDTMPSPALTTYITTYTKLSIGTFRVDLFQMALTGLAQGEYSINGSDAFTVGRDGLLDVSAYFGRTVKLCRLGSDEDKTVDSDPVSVDIISPVAAPTASQAGLDGVTTTLTEITIPKTDTTLEYQILDDNGNPVSAWKSGTGQSVTFVGLNDGTAYRIQVCIKQTATQPKSNGYISGQVYTKFYEETPAAVADTVSNALTKLVPNATYLIEGTQYRADAKGNILVADAWIGTQISIIKCGDGAKTVNSQPQKISLPGRVTTALHPTATGKVTYYGGRDGVIGNVDSQMEYSADGGLTWLVVTGSSIDGLAAQDYLVRYRGIANSLFASASKTVTVPVDTALADYKKQATDQLEKIYTDMVASKRYSEAQLAQICRIKDAGVEKINLTLSRPEDIDRAKDGTLADMYRVPCMNIATADGKLVGTDITSNTVLQYPQGSDEIWANVRNEAGLDAALLFVLQKQGKTDTDALRERFEDALKKGSILSTDEGIGADMLTTLLENAELKLGMDITLNKDAATLTQFAGTYVVTVLLPQDLQGIEGLDIISVGEDGSVSYHPAEITGNYLTFETTHFSVYGMVGKDTLAIAKAKALQDINDLSDSMKRDEYSDSNWNRLQKLFVGAREDVKDAKTEQEVTDAWNALLEAIQDTSTKRSLGWLWLLMVLIVLLVALMIACYLVWHVRYFDGDEPLCSEFHFWRTKVVLLATEKDGYVLEGWYYDPELTDRAETDFPMPWHTVKLYAKWNLIEILSEPEEPVAQEPIHETEPEQTEEALEEETVEENVPAEETPELDAPVEELQEEEATAEEETPDQLEAADDVPALPEATQQPEQTEEPEEAIEETQEQPALLEASEEEETALLEAADEVLALPAAAEENVTDGDEATMLEAPAYAGAPLLEAPGGADGESPAVVLLGEVGEEENEDGADAEEASYRSSASYLAWLKLGEGEDAVESEEPVITEDGDEVQLFVNEKTGEKYHIRFNLSFRAKMTSLSDEAKGFYRELKDEFLTYKGVKTRISWKAEGVRKGRETVARFAVRDNMLCVFLALDPDAYRDSKYVFESVKDIKAYEAVPMLVRVKSDLSCRKVKELIAQIMEPREVKRLDAVPETDYSYLDEDSSTEARLRAGQLRIWAEGPDDDVCANRAAAATLHYLISPEATAQEAEELISDEMLDALMPPAGEILIVPEHVGQVSTEQLCKKFYVGDVVDIETMKDKGLLEPKMTYVKITAQGDMTKKLTVHAHMFERTAAKMILLTGGDINMIQE